MKVKKQKGITLISLVVTIIILIILAGITLHLVLGENGIFNKAKYAKEKYLNEQALEGKIFDDLYEQLLKGELPENTKDTDAGTIVALPSNWYTTTPNYVETQTGEIVKKSVKVASVYAVATGNGESVPVPIGFYYVGGDFKTGVIISDNEDDKFDGKIDKTTYEYARNLKGNQFVFIPCSESEYTKTDWGSTYQDYSKRDTITSKAELVQIEKYGGFYVARYEAGLASNIPEFTTEQRQEKENQVYNQYGIPQSKEGQVPWIFIDWNYAKANAESMYKNDYISSGLITGTQWDVILNTIVENTELTEDDMIINSSKWGNFGDNSIDYHGRVAKELYKSKVYTTEPFSSEVIDGTTTNYNGNTSGEIGDLLTTGASEVAEQYHIFDIAGNSWEWTEEESNYTKTNDEYRVHRGGGAENISEDYPACYLGSATVDEIIFSIGFRVVLYIK